MDSEDLLDVIHRQILEAEAQFGAQIARSEKTQGTVDLLRSLRLREVASSFEGCRLLRQTGL